MLSDRRSRLLPDALFDAPAPEPLATARQMWELEQRVVLNESGQLMGELLRLQESSPGVPSADLAREQLQKLSPRKTEVFELVLEGLTNTAIAARHPSIEQVHSTGDLRPSTNSPTIVRKMPVIAKRLSCSSKIRTAPMAHIAF